MFCVLPFLLLFWRCDFFNSGVVWVFGYCCFVCDIVVVPLLCVSLEPFNYEHTENKNTYIHIYIHTYIHGCLGGRMVSVAD